MNDHVDIWVKARALIAEPRNWCQGAVARDATGRALNRDFRSVDAAVFSQSAVSFCLAGAMGRAAGDFSQGMESCSALADMIALPERDRAIYPGGFNDTHSHAEVLALLDRGIASARASRTLPALLDIPSLPVLAKEPA
jgi:hypothetical protein